MNKAQLQYSTPSSSKLSKRDDHDDTLRVLEMQRGGEDGHGILGCEDAEEEDRFQDYYGIVVESRQELAHPEQRAPSGIRNEAQERPSSNIRFLKRETPKPCLPPEAVQRAISPPHSVKISVQRSKEQEPRKEVPNYMKPTQKTLMQKELETDEQNTNPKKADKDGNTWDERFWLQAQGPKAEQEVSPAKLPGAKGKKFKDVKARVDTTRNQQKPYNQSVVVEPTGKFTELNSNRRYTSKENMKKALIQVASAQAIIKRARAQTQKKDGGSDQQSPTAVVDVEKSPVVASKPAKRAKAPPGNMNSPARKEQKSQTKEEEDERRLYRMKRARTPKPEEQPSKDAPPVANDKKGVKKEKEKKRPARRNSQTFKSKDLKVVVEQKRESYVEIKKGTNELQQLPVHSKKMTDFIQKNKSIPAKEQQMPKTIQKSMTERLKVSTSLKKQGGGGQKDAMPKRERERSKKEEAKVKKERAKKEEVRASPTRIEKPKSKANRKSVKLLSSSTIKLSSVKQAGEQGQLATSSTARISESSTLLQPTVSTRKKTRKQKGKPVDRASSARSRMSVRSCCSSLKSRPDDGSVQSVDSNDDSEDKSIEKPRIANGNKESEALQEEKVQPGTARFLSPFNRERVFNSASTDQIERATGIVIRQSRLKQKLQDRRRSAFNRFLLLDIDQIIAKKICQYLHEPKINLPGYTIWKFALLSKMHYSIVSKLYHMSTLNSNYNVEEFMQMLSQKPQLTKLLGNQENLKMLKQLCKSYIFGGSVFEQIRTADVKAPAARAEVAKANKLYPTILANASKAKSQSRYFILRNVMLDSSYLLVDIYILVSDPEPSTSPSLSPLRDWHSYTKRKAQLAQELAVEQLNEDISVAEEKEKEETIQKLYEEDRKEKQQEAIQAEVHNKDLSHVIDQPMQPPPELSNSVDHASLQDDSSSPKKLLPRKVQPNQEQLYHNRIQEKKKPYESPYRVGTTTAKSNPNEIKMVESKPAVPTFSSIRPLLNGYARMIVYEYVGSGGKASRLTAQELKERIQEQDFQGIDDDSFSVQRMLEGEFKDGQLINYGRVLDAEEGLCQVGFWKPLTAEDQAKYCKDQRHVHKRSVPWGQWAQYQADGSQKKGFEEGIYMGRSKRNPDGFKQILKGGFASYEARIEPEMSFWTKLQDNCCGI